MGSEPPAKNHRELIVWQLCAKLRSMIWKYTRDGPAAKDRRYCDQIRPAARSACYCTSEGFYRNRDGDFLNFLVMARASLGEIDDQLDEGLEIDYFTKEQHAQMKQCLARACKANGGLRAYLERCIASRKGPRVRKVPKVRKSGESGKSGKSGESERPED
jgi:four helix bundle protein